MTADKLANLLKDQLSSIAHSTRPADLQHFGQDWTRFYTPNPGVIFYPDSTEQVQQIMKVAYENNQPVVPSGGRTGYSAGAVATNGEWVISLVRLNQIGEFNAVDRTVQVGAGVITEQLQIFAEEQGLMYPVDFASAGSSHIGGNIATNAGGIKVLRYGLTRDYVMGLTVVTAQGELLDLNKGLVKNATGPDLRHLMIGSEGILGIIVAAEMKLIESPPAQMVMLLSLAHLSAVMATFSQAQRHLKLSSFEFFSDRALKRVMAHRSLANPFDDIHPYYVLLEFDEDEDAAMHVFEHGLGVDDITDGIIAQSIDQADQLWQYREGISESIAEFTPYKNDISVTINKVTDFMQRLDALLVKEYPNFETIWFGHIGDGNLHLNILKPEKLSVADFKQQCETVNDHVYGLIQELGGSISAEHGVGLLKKPYLSYSKSAGEINWLKAIKNSLDRKGILNPGKVID
ncbi:MAG: FAD-binding oxidoreductase [Proteobacteria bacterium]|nr:MAG: FAD-binding oxidoreductase [Pseudomonadota bacterium]